jgi:hypothetical protein
MMRTVKEHVLECAIVTIPLLPLRASGWDGADTVPPGVVGTNPQNGMQSVDPSIKEISVAFNEQMMDKSWSWCYEERETFPQMTGAPYYSENNTKNMLPVE